MWLSKAETWALAENIGGEAFVQLIVEETHTCYRGDRSQRHPWGYGCGSCPACGSAPRVSSNGRRPADSLRRPHPAANGHPAATKSRSPARNGPMAYLFPLTHISICHIHPGQRDIGQGGP